MQKKTDKGDDAEEKGNNGGAKDQEISHEKESNQDLIIDDFLFYHSQKKLEKTKSFELQYKVEFQGAEIKRNNGTMLLCSLRHQIMTLSFGNHGPFLGKSLLNRFCQRNFKHSN